MDFPEGCFGLQIECGVHTVDVFLVQFLTKEFRCFTKSLEMDDLPLPEELNYIIHIRVIRKPQDIVVGDPCFLLCQGVP